MNGIKKWPEKTTMSPSGRHLGIYKTLQQHLKEKDKETKKQWMNKQNHPCKSNKDETFFM